MRMKRTGLTLKRRTRKQKELTATQKEFKIGWDKAYADDRAARAKAAAIREAEQRVLAVAGEMEALKEDGCELIAVHSIGNLWSAVRHLRALGWKPKS